MELKGERLVVFAPHRELLAKLVSEELDRRCQAIDDIVAAGYGEFIGKRAESNAEAVKVAVLELLRSPLADLERKLAAPGIEPEPEPEPEPEVEPEAEPAEEPDPGPGWRQSRR